MKRYAGIDLHSNNSVIHLVDENGALVVKKRMANELARMLALLQPYIGSIVGLVVESTYNWYWLVDGLVEAGHKVQLTNTAAIQQYSELKHADANWLANMLRLGILPAAIHLPKTTTHVARPVAKTSLARAAKDAARAVNSRLV